MTGLPAAKWAVARLDNDNAHYYRVTAHDGGEIGIYPGITGRGNVLGGGKTKALTQWGANLAARKVWEAVMSILDGDEDEDLLTTPGFWDALYEDARYAHKAALEEAGDRGTELHLVFERIVKGQDPLLSGAPVTGFSDWWKAKGWEPVATELMVAHPELGFGGTLDFLGRKKESGLWVLADWKTSNSIDKVEYGMQLGALNAALEATYGISAEELVCVRIDKETGKVEEKHLTDPLRAMRIFHMCLQLEPLVKERLLQ